MDYPADALKLGEQGTVKIETGARKARMYILRLSKNDGTTEVIRIIK